MTMSEKGRRDRRAEESAETTAQTTSRSDAGPRSSGSAGPLGTMPRWAEDAGRPVEPEVRREMESELGHDFGDVRIHDGPAAHAATNDLQADAFTVGDRIAFGAGQDERDPVRGRHLLAHELTHVVQADSASAEGAQSAAPAVSRQDSPVEREAHEVGAHASGRGGPGPAPRPTKGLAPHGVVHRFDSFEHIELGDRSRGGPVAGGPPSSYSTGFILLDCHTRDLPGHATPTVGWPADWVARYHSGTPEQRRAITLGLTYGEIMAFSGDMHAAVDPATNATSVVASMERINRASLREIYDLIPLLHSQPRADMTADLESATGGRYMALARKNVSHFSNVTGGRDNMSTWRDGHRAALRIAASGDANAAWAMNAAADHFLTDAFAAGHLRPDRAHDITSTTGQINSKELHDLDNDFGVDVHNRRGDRWTQYGDDHLDDAADTRGRAIALEAVSMSKADVQAALDAAAAGTPPPPTGAPGAFASEQLAPIVDSWTTNRWGRADLAAEVAHLARTELPEQAVPNGDTRAREWVARQPPAALLDVPVEEKTRMVNRMLSGWVSGDDLDGIERLYRNSRTADQIELRRAIAPQVGDLISPWQQARLRTLISVP